MCSQPAGTPDRSAESVSSRAHRTEPRVRVDIEAMNQCRRMTIRRYASSIAMHASGPVDDLQVVN
jgi:hypothetical protein